MFWIKNGVRFSSPVEAMFYATLAIVEVCREFGVDCVFTCSLEAHQFPSKHLEGAKDFRTRDLREDQKIPFRTAVRSRLNNIEGIMPDDYKGRAFDVVLEPDHLHIEYDPKD